MKNTCFEYNFKFILKVPLSKVWNVSGKFTVTADIIQEQTYPK